MSFITLPRLYRYLNRVILHLEFGLNLLKQIQAVARTIRIHRMRSLTCSPKTLLIAFSAASFSQLQADPDLIFTGEFSKGEGQIQLTEDLNFNITSNGFVSIFAFDDIVDFDGSFTFGGPLDLSLLLNSNPVSSELVDLFDNLNNTVGDLNSSDAYLPFRSFGEIEVTAGSVLTWEAGTWNNLGGAGFNPQYDNLGRFNGNIILTDFSGSKLAEAQVIPEPSALGLLLIGSLTLVRRRR